FTLEEEPMRVLAGRRPEVMLLASLLIFVTMLTIRALLDRPAGSVAVDTAAPAPAPIERSDEGAIAKLQDRIRRNPDDTVAYGQLGLALLQRVRDTADPMLYPRSEAACPAALMRVHHHIHALLCDA